MHHAFVSLAKLTVLLHFILTTSGVDEALHMFSDTNSIVEPIHRCVGWPFSCVCRPTLLKKFGKSTTQFLRSKTF